ncbi:MAG: LPXTG cell wall anchor domain-containing protein [Actinomycetota bacterium]|nr:LPXTG cell wall anchor domain-containing protein [Actinomycetota bacterium]
MLAVLLVSTLVLASAAPMAFSQASAGEGGDSGNVTIVDCSQVQNAFGIQDQYSNATAQYQSEAIAVVSQEMNIAQNQVNACLGGQPDGNNDDGDADNGAADSEDADTEAIALNEGKDDVLAGTTPEDELLPNTGGPSLLAAAVGVALIVGGASLIRFRR